MFLVRIAPRFRRGFFLLGRSAGIPAGVLVFGGIGFSLSSFLLSIPKLNSKETFMSSLKAVGRSTAARKVGRLTATNKTDRVSLCTFSFSDGRRCRTPRLRNNAHFCFYHAQKEARAGTTQKLGKDLAYFFSGDYLSACDLSTALARLIPAAVRGDVKPRAARTVAYLAQTLMQSIHISQHEYINAFGTDGWRQSIRNSVKGNYDYRFPPPPKPEPPPQPAPTPPPANRHSDAVAQAFRPEESAFSSTSSPATHHSPPPQTPAPSLHTPLPPTSAEFVQHLLAGLERSVRP